MRRVNQALYLLTTGAREAAFRNIKTIAECLADELINAAKGSSNRCAPPALAWSSTIPLSSRLLSLLVRQLTWDLLVAAMLSRRRTRLSALPRVTDKQHSLQACWGLSSLVRLLLMQHRAGSGA